MSPAPVPAAASPRVAGLLRGAPDQELPVLHRGPDAVYVVLAGSALGVLSREAVPVPCGLRTRLPSVPPVSSATVSGGVLRLDGVPHPVGRLVEVGVPRLDQALVVAGTLDGDDVARLLGRGPGLTPYGDDVLCGWLAVHRAAGLATPDVDAAVAAGAGRTTLLAATLLGCAGRGEVVPAFAAWLAALGTRHEARAAAQVRRIGASSGAGLLAGAALALGRTSTVDTVAEVAA